MKFMRRHVFFEWPSTRIFYTGDKLQRLYLHSFLSVNKCFQLIRRAQRSRKTCVVYRTIKIISKEYGDWRSFLVRTFSFCVPIGPENHMQSWVGHGSHVDRRKFDISRNRHSYPLYEYYCFAKQIGGGYMGSVYRVLRIILCCQESSDRTKRLRLERVNFMTSK